MSRSGDDRESQIGPRAKSGIIVGYIAMVLGLLAVVGQASEIKALPMNIAALVVLVHMLAGYGIGWLIQPLISRWFST